MARKRGIPDRTSAGRSSVVPYKRGENGSDRHSRRLNTNSRYETAVRQWCVEHGFEVCITNHHHHWQMRKGTFLAEWWPSSAKLVCNKKWREGIHCHDYQQALKVIERSYGNSLRDPEPLGSTQQPLPLGFTDDHEMPVTDEVDDSLAGAARYLCEIQFEVEDAIREPLKKNQPSLWDKLVRSSVKFDGGGCDGILMREVEIFTESLLGKMSDGELHIIWKDTENGVMAIGQGFVDADRVEMIHDIALDIYQTIADHVCE